MSDSIDLRPLFAEYTNGTISVKQLQELESALREDSQLRQDFIEYMNVDAALGDLAALSKAELAAVEQDAARFTADNFASGGESAVGLRTFRVAAIVGIVAATLLLLSSILWFTFSDDDEVQPVATLITDVDAILLHDGKRWNDTQLHVGEYRLTQGLLHLQFGRGVTVYIEAPARFDVLSAERLLLHSGRLSASVPQEGIGFTVATPEAEVIDFGTEFGVDVQSGTSEVHVYNGLVRVQPRTSGGKSKAEAVDLRTSQAIKIESATETPIDIELAVDRFIRDFDEPQKKLCRVVKDLKPVAYYRMPIRRGFPYEPLDYSGELLLGEGSRPPRAPGFLGGSLLVGGKSTGRGAVVTNPPRLSEGTFSLTVTVYVETRAPGSMVVTNLDGEQGCFSLSVDEFGKPVATIRTADGGLVSCAGDFPLPIRQWCHLVMTADGEHLRLFLDSEQIAESQCAAMASSESDTIWFGTDGSGEARWNGRIDELALYNRSLSRGELQELFRVAREMARTKHKVQRPAN